MIVLGIPIDSSEVIGISGGILFFASYWLVSRGKVKGEGVLYNMMVLIGCMLYFVYAYIKGAASLIVLEILFIIISVKALYNCYRAYQEKNNLKKIGN